MEFKCYFFMKIYEKRHGHCIKCFSNNVANITRVIQKVLPVGSYLCSGKRYAFKIFYNNTFDLWLHCVKISFLYLLYFFLGAPNSPAGFGAPETEKK